MNTPNSSAIREPSVRRRLHQGRGVRRRPRPRRHAAGAIGPNGLAEKDANLAIAPPACARARGAQVFLTRDVDFTAGTRLPQPPGERPRRPRPRVDPQQLGSRRSVEQAGNRDLAPAPVGAAPSTRATRSGELVEACRRSRSNWVADHKAGTRTRLNQDGHDYYGMLRGIEGPDGDRRGDVHLQRPRSGSAEPSPEGQEAVAGRWRAVISVTSRSRAGGQPSRTSPPSGTTGGVPAGCVDPA